MRLTFAATVLIALSSTVAHGEPVKNVIVMLADGAGYNTHAATKHFPGGEAPFRNDQWLKLPTSTYNLRGGQGDLDNDEQDPALVYDPVRAWDTTPVEGESAYRKGFAAVNRGYEWLRATCPDSAGTMSALMTGRRIYYGAINVDGFGKPVLTVPEVAKASGRMTGAISSVRFTHATPASAGGAHSINRGNEQDIACEMFGSGTLDLLAGPGNPDYDNDGQPHSPRYGRVPEALWKSLQAGRGVTSHTAVDGRSFTVDASWWQLVERKEDIQALAAGSATPTPGRRLAMVAQVYDALQYHRAGASREEHAFSTPFLQTVPTLTDFTNASLRYLGGNPGGFFLMIEGGAVDWAMHGHHMGRMIEEQIDFHQAVQAVIDYLDADTHGNNWENTLVIITADHDHLLYGPDSGDSQPYQLVQPDDPHDDDNLPEHRWHSNHHGNQLVPAWFRGAGAGDFAKLATKVDPYLTTDGGFNPAGDGTIRYLGQDDIGRKLMELVSKPAARR